MIKMHLLYSSHRFMLAQDFSIGFKSFENINLQLTDYIHSFTLCDLCNEALSVIQCYSMFKQQCIT